MLYKKSLTRTIPVYVISKNTFEAECNFATSCTVLGVTCENNRLSNQPWFRKPVMEISFSQVSSTRWS